MDRDAVRRRDAAIVRLNEAGWSLRLIGRDPWVRLSPEGVRQVLLRLDAVGEPLLDALAVWRDARLGHPHAIKVLGQLTTRTDEVAARRAVERWGAGWRS